MCRNIGNSLNVLFMLMWKNWLLQKRKIILTLFEIGLPTFIAFMLLLTKQWVERDVIPSKSWKSFAIDPDLMDNIGVLSQSEKLLYAPNSSAIENIMLTVQSLLHGITVLGFECEEDLVEHFLTEKNKTITTHSGIVFDTSITDSSLPTNISYKIRPKDYGFPETQFPRSKSVMGPFNAYSNYGSYYDYFHGDSILVVQQAIDKAIIMTYNSTAQLDTINVRFQRMPYPAYINDFLMLIVKSSMPLFLMFSYMVLVINIVKEVVLEKEKKLEESIKLIGVSGWLQWIAWFLKFFIFVSVISLIITLCFKLDFGNGLVINKTDFTVLFISLLLYGYTVIMFSFAITTLFSKANVAAAAGGILFFLSHIPNFIILSGEDFHNLTHSKKLLWCLVPNVAMSVSFEMITLSEISGMGQKWSNIATGVDVHDDFTLAHVFMMFIISGLILGVFTWYVDEVHPGDYGVPKPIYFLFTKSYWCGRHSTMDAEEGLLSGGELIEPVPTNAKLGIKVRNLRKEFKQIGMRKVAVDDLSLNAIEDQITALLGHNGAGKTTTMFMLTGFIPPTKGTALVNGYNVISDIENVRTSLGLCPQHNILYDTLTVKEHLEFFARVKGCPRKQVQKEVKEMITLLNLENKTNTFTRCLSGGMKRKLSVGIALIAGSKIVILDEPTSGMDPEARRQTWDILKSQRAGRTMLLSTHFMDEADYLGDRIAIMASGNVVCAGSSLFLKKKYGVGYHMSMVKDIHCNIDQVDEVIMKHVPEAGLESNISAELSYVLPHQYSGNFESLFTDLEENKDALGILSFGASVTTMEEVFLKVGAGEDIKNNQPGINDENAGHIVYGIEYQKNTGVKLYIQQFYGMLLKRIIYSKRSYVVSIVQILVPLLFAFLACVPIILSKAEFSKIGKDRNPVSISFSEFNTPKVPYDVAVTAETSVQPLLNAFKDSLLGGVTTVDLNYESSFNSTVLENYLLDLGETDLRSYIQSYLLAGYFDANETTKNVHLFYQGEAFHSPCLATNVLGNTLLQYFTGSSNYHLKVTIHPLPKPPMDEEALSRTNNNISTAMVFSTLNFGISFLVATFVVLVIRERNINAKHCQFISGVHTINFWISAFTWDMTNYVLSVIGVIIVYAAFGIPVYADNLGYVVLLLFMYGFAAIPFVYVASFLFSQPASGYVWLSIINIFTGMIFTLIINVLKVIKNTEAVGNFLSWLAYFTLPNYCLSTAIFNLVDCDQKDSCNFLEWEYPAIGKDIIFLAVQGAEYFILLFTIDSGFGNRIKKTMTSVFTKAAVDIEIPEAATSVFSTTRQVLEDDDVHKEREEITQLGDEAKSSYPLILSDVTKFYGHFKAVDNLSIGIKKGECFGLLGVNGAGKTTTFKMLTGDESITKGEAYVDGHSVTANIKKVQQCVGYCPQFDALIDKLTVTETLYMYARLRGVKESYISEVANNLIKILLLEEFKNKCAGNLSGGNKRKLSTAIALVGDPPIVFLDEPTSGMDPVARRHLWNTVSQLQQAGRTLVLTSHSMEECEALCTRITIMVNGQFKCLGSCQRLKSKFGQGYTLMAKVTVAETHEETDQWTENLMEFIEKEFKNCVLKDMHPGLVLYQVNDTELTWARIFGTMERAKVEYHIEDYSVNQTTLEQVFISFARTQKPPKSGDKLLKVCRICCCKKK